MNGEKRFGAFEREMLDNYDCPLASVRTFNVIFVCFVLYFDSSLSVFFFLRPDALIQLFGISVVSIAI